MNGWSLVTHVLNFVENLLPQCAASQQVQQRVAVGSRERPYFTALAAADLTRYSRRRRCCCGRCWWCCCI